MKREIRQVSLSTLFLRILVSGLCMLILVSYVLMEHEHDAILKRWQMDTVQHSSSATSSYYASLITKIVLGKDQDVTNILRLNQVGENVDAIAIVPHANIALRILETCEVDPNQSFFHQVPTCYEYETEHLVIYHELRSVGYNLGYLRKEVSLPKIGLWENTLVAKSLIIVLVCFVSIMAIFLLCLRRYFITPIKRLSKLLRHKGGDAIAKTDFSVQELQQLADAMQSAFREVATYQSQAKQLEYEAKLGKMASQVAHDVRSPLTALKVLSTHVEELPEAKRVMLRNAVNRIDDIANDLIVRNVQRDDVDETAANADTPSVQLLSCLIESLISEKRVQFRSKLQVTIQSSLDQDSYGLFSKLNPVEFKRVLSNLINNAVEAMKQPGSVTVDAQPEGEHVIVRICDTGGGIAPEILPKLTERGATFGKKGGLGLGLYHARTTIESWGGEFSIASIMGKGTTICLKLPQAEPPAWFVPELVIAPTSTVVIVDDDTSIHQVWDGRFTDLRLAAHEIVVQHFSSGAALSTWPQEHSRVLFLCDYELIGEPSNGLDLIEKLQAQDRAILVTSRYEEQPVRERCAALGVRLIPKDLAGFVPIRIAESPINIPEALPKQRDASVKSDKPTALVLDDDDDIRCVWPMEGRRLGLASVTTFASMEACEAAAPDYAQFDFAFVDKNIPDSVWRLDQIIMHLKACGVKKVLVASGESARALANDPLCAAADGVMPMKIPQKLPT